jgi:type IV pilus assembly protein PilB
MKRNFVINNFLQHLIAENALTDKNAAQLISAVKNQQTTVVSYLINKKIVDSCNLAKMLAKEFGLVFIDLDTVQLQNLPLNLIEHQLLEKYSILPLWCRNGTLGLAIIDPTQHLVIDEIRFHTELNIEKFMVDAEKLHTVLVKIMAYKQLEKNKKKERVVKISEQRFEIQDLQISNTDLDNEMAIIHYVYKLLQCAIVRGASDIHLEPHQEYLQIRFRIDGLLYLMVTLPPTWIQRIIARLKIMSQLDIAERRIPQDGRFQIQDASNHRVDCRISTCPTLFGEKLVLRILDSNKMALEIEQLGMNEAQKQLFIQVLRYPHGLILVTGPTGSGKTITLYTALNFLNKTTCNISSVEHPVEIILPGINQVNINPKVGLNWATVLRAFLRQDPDVILVGEMRDQETAEIGIKAGQTGHLVLSSLHTNNAAESLIRLANMGIPRYNVASCVNLIIAQRLARRLCLHCKVQEELPQSILSELHLNRQDLQSITLFKAQGCRKCTEGYYGRIGIFEMLAITDDISNLILAGCSAKEITLHAQKKGMQTLYAATLEKVARGETSLLEMKRIIKD